MSLTDINQTITTNMQGATGSNTFSNEPWNKNTEGFYLEQIGTNSNSYMVDWPYWHGIYRKIPEMRSTIDVWVRWIIGKKLITDEKTQKIINRINGIGKDTFRKVLFNLKRTSKICGVSFGEIIRDKAKRLINLKVLNPGTIRTVANDLGIIERYEQVVTDNTGSKIVLNSWTPDRIFHLINERIADEIGGIPEAEKLINIIKWSHIAKGDNSVIIHRYGKPTFFYEVDTDDETEMATIKTKIDNTFKNFENMVTPKGTLIKVDRVATPQYSTIDPMPWMIFLRSYFTESSGVPDLIRGKSDEVSLAAGKLNFLGFKEKIIQEQIDFSEDIEAQLGLKIEFAEPVQIDIEIVRTEEAMDKKAKAKEQKGGQLMMNMTDEHDAAT